MKTYSNLKVIALLFVFLTSCNTNDFEEPTVNTDLNYLTIKSANFKSELINDYAKILAISLSDEIKIAINEYTGEGKKNWYEVRAVNNDGYSGFSNIVATTSSARYDGEWLKIKGMKFTSSYLSYVESWVSGAPEIRLRVVQGLQGGANVIFTSGILEPNGRADIKDKWWYSEIPIVQWYTATLGTVINLDWREEDPWPSGTVSFDITGSYEDKNDGGTVKYGGNITINNDPGDSHIGSNLVHYWDVKSQISDYTGFMYQLVY